MSILNIHHGIIVHQVNCRGVMGAGLAKSLRSRYTSIFQPYAQHCKAGTFRPGMVQFIPVSPTLHICNLAGQDGFGRDRQYSDYGAIAVALAKVYQTAIAHDLPVYIPHGMGCGLAGGDWSIVSKLIAQHCPIATIVSK
jgi:O-acetyl-ADP-ribose deacetylase (regulator of RNase III)